MDTSPLPGFITRSQAAERCKRSERSLQRYWSKAIEQEVTDVLERLKLRTEDSEVFDGTAVTKKLIDQLKNNGRNPTWFVHATWAMKKYGPRIDGVKEKEPQSAPQVGTNEHRVDSASLESEVIRLLKDQMRERGEEITYLRDELKIKNAQIQEATDRTRESNVLMKELQTLLGDVQRRALLPLPNQRGQATEPRSVPTDVVVEDEPKQSTELQHGRSSPAVNVRPRSTQNTKRKAKTQQTPTSLNSSTSTHAAERRKPKWHEFPTFKKLFSRR